MRPRLAASLWAAPFAAAFLALNVSTAADNQPISNRKPAAPGLGNPGALVSIEIESGRAGNDAKQQLVTIAGRDAVQQLVVTGHYKTGQVRDLTRTVTYEVSPSGIVEADSTGLLTPIAEGTATVHVVAQPGFD